MTESRDGGRQLIQMSEKLAMIYTLEDKNKDIFLIS
jgi:hypothetical protein